MEIYLKYCRPVLIAVIHRFRATDRSCVVYQDVHRSELLCFLEQFFCLSRLRKIGLNRKRSASDFFDLPAGLFRRAQVSVAHHIGSCFSQGRRHGCTQSRRGAGYQRRFAVKPEAVKDQ